MIKIVIFNASSKLENKRYIVQNYLFCKHSSSLVIDYMCCIDMSFNGVVLSFIDNFIKTLYQLSGLPRVILAKKYKLLNFTLFVNNINIRIEL